MSKGNFIYQADESTGYFFLRKGEKLLDKFRELDFANAPESTSIGKIKGKIFSSIKTVCNMKKICSCLFPDEEYFLGFFYFYIQNYSEGNEETEELMSKDLLLPPQAPEDVVFLLAQSEFCVGFGSNRGKKL